MTHSPVPLESDVQFLTEQFGIPPFKAARLVAGRTERVEELIEKELQRQHQLDPLAGVPTPRPPKNEFRSDVDEAMLKPLVGDHNLRGAG